MMSISERQWQLINLASEGSTDKEIAQEMGISVGTVRTYWDRLRRRYECRNRSEVIVKALFRRTTDEFNSSLLNALPLFIWRMDAQGVVSFKNEWFSTSSRKERVPSTILAFVAHEEREQVGLEISQAFKKGARFEKVTTFVVGPKEDRKLHKIILTPMRSKDNMIDHWLGYGREVGRDADDRICTFLAQIMDGEKAEASIASATKLSASS